MRTQFSPRQRANVTTTTSSVARRSTQCFENWNIVSFLRFFYIASKAKNFWVCLNFYAKIQHYKSDTPKNTIFGHLSTKIQSFETQHCSTRTRANVFKMKWDNFKDFFYKIVLLCRIFLDCWHNVWKSSKQISYEFLLCHSFCIRTFSNIWIFG